MIGQVGRWTQTPSATPLQPKKWNADFWIMFNFLWLARLVNGFKPHLQPLSNQKNEMLIFGLRSTSDDRPVQLLMIGQVGRRTPTPSATSFQPKKWNAHFCIMFKFWWSAKLVDGLKPHLPPISNQTNEMLVLYYVIVLMISWAGQWTWTLSTTCLQPRNEMLIFGLRSTSDDWPGWSMDSNSICYPSPAKKMKCLFLDYVQLLIIGQAGQWTRTPSATPLQPKKWNACFWIMFNFWWLARLVDGCKSHLAALSSQKNEYLIFGLCSTSDDQLGWLMDSILICHPSPTKKMKYLFLYYVQLLMMGLAAWWTLTPSANFLQPNNEMLIFGLCSTSDDQLGWSMDSNPIHHTSPGIKWNVHFWITF